jgi:phage terminase large subunit-like protein
MSRVSYLTWHRQGLLEALAGRAIDKLAIVKQVAKLASIIDIQAIAYDRWRLEDLQKLLPDEGIDIPLKAWGQGFKDMGLACDALETAILHRRLTHPNHPILNWNIANAVIELDPTGARKIGKAKSTERADGAMVLATVGPPKPPRRSVYKDPTIGIWS